MLLMSLKRSQSVRKLSETSRLVIDESDDRSASSVELGNSNRRLLHKESMGDVKVSNEILTVSSGIFPI